MLLIFPARKVTNDNVTTQRTIILCRVQDGSDHLMFASLFVRYSNTSKRYEAVKREKES